MIDMPKRNGNGQDEPTPKWAKSLSADMRAFMAQAERDRQTQAKLSQAMVDALLQIDQTLDSVVGLLGQILKRLPA